MYQAETLTETLQKYADALEKLSISILKTVRPNSRRIQKKKKQEIIEIYNNFTLFGVGIYNRVKKTDQLNIEKTHAYFIKLVERVFKHLDVVVLVPVQLGSLIIDLDDSQDSIDISTSEEEKEEAHSSSQRTPIKQKQSPTKQKEQEKLQPITEHIDSEEEIPQQESNTISLEKDTSTTETMPLTLADIVKMGIGLVPIYDGSPEGLEKFIAAIELLYEMAGQDNEEHVLKFIKTRLEQRARNCLPTELATVQQLKTALKGQIKPIDSEVIRSKLAALRYDRMQLHEFSAKAEELADQFHHALIIETGNTELAQKQPQKELIKVCRSNARSDLTKAVIASTSFANPREVLAKFVTEIAEEKGEKNVLYMNRRPYRGRYRGNQNYGYNRYNNYNENQCNNQQNRGRRGNRRGNYQRRGGNQQQNFNNNQNAGYNNRSQQYIRSTGAEQGNETTPQIIQLGENNNN